MALKSTRKIDPDDLKLATLLAAGGTFWYAAHENRKDRKMRKALRRWPLHRH